MANEQDEQQQGPSRAAKRAWALGALRADKKKRRQGRRVVRAMRQRYMDDLLELTPPPVVDEQRVPRPPVLPLTDGQRINHYLEQTGRKQLTVAQARRVRKQEARVFHRLVRSRTVQDG